MAHSTPITRAAACALAILTAAPLFADTQSAVAGNPAVLSGTWSGEGDQNNGASWSIDITFTSQVEAQISYASIPCAGVLYMVATSDEGTVYREQLTSNAQNCIDDGRVTLSLQNGTLMRYTWEKDGDTAMGALRRTGD